MSKIEQLIQELCPGGVVKLPLEELCEFRNGYTPSKANKEFWEDGDIPWFRMEDIREGGRILSDSKQHITQKAIKAAGLFKANSIILATTATIGEHAMIIADSLANQRFTNLSIRKSLSLNVEPKYLFYYMFLVDEWCKNHVNVSGFASVDMAGLKKLEIPLPPLPIQQEIVRILDTFTEAQANLEQELDLRKKQYEYYRNQLLTFDENDPSVKWMTLGDCGKMIKGNGILKSDFVDSGVPCIHYGQLHTYYGLSATSTISYISEGLAKKSRFAHKGDLVIATTSEDVEACCKACAWFGEEAVAVSGDAHIFVHDQNPKYMAYLFRTNDFAKQKQVAATGAKVTRVSGDNMLKFKFLFPSKERQQEIVSILDKFESAIQTLEEELALRKKQYEYYREKLLTFN